MYVYDHYCVIKCFNREREQKTLKKQHIITKPNQHLPISYSEPTNYKRSIEDYHLLFQTSVLRGMFRFPSDLRRYKHRYWSHWPGLMHLALDLIRSLTLQHYSRNMPHRASPYY